MIIVNAVGQIKVKIENLIILFKKGEGKEFYSIWSYSRNKKITISWTENLIEEDIVELYYLYISKEQCRTSINTKISILFYKNQNNCIYTINDLYNNTQYGIQLIKFQKFLRES